ncbi:desiccation-related protein PCC13-62-like [Nymphaea colorata]|nr:desiccation-related protein PCC13-62-like [Nymphaea colorata]
MAVPSFFLLISILSALLMPLSGLQNVSSSTCMPAPPADRLPVYPSDLPRIQFALNLEHLEAAFFCYGALGHGLDVLAPELVMGGPPSIGAMKANLNPLVEDIIEQFCYQEIAHIRVITETVGPFPRPLMDLSVKNFAHITNVALGRELNPPFDPYANTVNFLIATYWLPYMGLTAYVGTDPNLLGYWSHRLVSGLLGVEAGQDAIDRGLLYQMKEEKVEPYNITVAEFTNHISILRNCLGGCGIKDEGLIVPLELGSENKTCGNILSADVNSLSYARTAAETLRVIYSTGDEHVPGGFLPKGGNGEIARSYLHHH